MTVTNLGSPTNEAVQGVSVAYSIMGCSAAPTEGNGPVDITVAVNNRLGQTVATQTVTSTSDDPSVPVTGDIYVGVPDVQYLWVTCTPAEGDAVSASSAGFYMTEGTITASQGDKTVIAADQPVTLTSDSITGPGGSSYPFMPGAGGHADHHRSGRHDLPGHCCRRRVRHRDLGRPAAYHGHRCLHRDDDRHEV